jgi:hypothetical protein
MSILLEKTDLDCANIGCSTKLGFFDIKKKRRFCRKCRIISKVLEWKCKKCDNIISNSSCRETRRLCNNCQPGKKASYEPDEDFDDDVDEFT